MENQNIGCRRICAGRFGARIAIGVGVISVLGAGASGNDTPSEIRFTDATIASGMVYTQVHGPSPKYPNMLAGGAVGDFNNDGYHDVFVLGNGGVPDGLFINNTDGTFENRASQWAMDVLHYAFGASAADFNNDGYLDLFITSYGTIDGGGVRPGQMRLMRNNGPDAFGQWSFTDVAGDAGVNSIHPSATDGTGSAWGDIDLDGDLDLFVGGYNANRQVNRMFRNDGPDSKGVWRFSDITDDAGLVHHHWSTFVPGFLDLTGDGYPELMAISDHGSGVYWVNNADGTFTNRNDLAEPTDNGMGLDFGDVNGDGLIDYYASSIAWDASGPGNELMIQQPDGSFIDRAHDTGCFAGYWGWGVALADLDHDRDLDIVETNGFSIGGGSSPAVVFENNGDGSAFAEIAEQCGLDHRMEGRGLVKFDSDNDGDLDIVIFASGGETAFFRNEVVEPGAAVAGDAHWVRVILDTRANDRLSPQGIGSVVYARAGGVEHVLPVHSGSSHCSSSPIEVHTGLGVHAQIDALRVVWADGSQTTMTGISADRVLKIDARVSWVDLDGSGAVDFADVNAFVTGYLASDLNADFTNDWALDIFDVFAFIGEYRAAIGK